MTHVPTTRRLRRRTLSCAIALAFAGSAAAEAPQQLPEVQIQGNYINSVGSSDAASQGVVTSKLIESRATLRPAEVLEFVPGIIVTQHSGDGKANQYFLRGFNLDHGTDFASFVDGMPVNMPTHAHGHGYSDLNWLIPELVDRIEYKKGPYFADEGDFASAGAARIRLFGTLPAGLLSATAGEHGYRRGLLAHSMPLGNGHLLFALEGAHNNGPWDSPEKFHRANGVLRYSFGTADSRSSITAMAYSAGWNASDQIPQRAVDQGVIGRFGTIDPSDGGQTSRVSLSFNTERRSEDGLWKLNAYAIQSSLDLYSNFTFFLDNPVDGDQFQQSERRKVMGLATSRAWNTTFAGRSSTNTIGLQLRHDRLAPVGLYTTVARERLVVTQESVVRQTSLGVYAEKATQWTPWLRSLAGLRGDRFNFDVKSSIAQNSGQRNASIVSPKLSLIFGPWQKTEFFVNYGWGFHSNDARGTTASVTARDTTQTAERVDPLVRSKAAKSACGPKWCLGCKARSRCGSCVSHRSCSSSATPARPSRTAPASATASNGTTTGSPSPGCSSTPTCRSRRHASATPPLPARATMCRAPSRPWCRSAPPSPIRGPWFGQLQLRYFGPRPLVEDNSQRSKATTLAYLRAGYKLTKDVKLALDVFNLFDRKASDIDYYYASRLNGEAAEGVNDIHFHPVEPRSLRLSLMASF